MGSSYSRSARSSASVKSISSTKSKKLARSKVGSSSSDEEIDNNLNFSAGFKANDSFTHERKDSKKYWISHIRLRKKSSGDVNVRRTSSERKPSSNFNANSNLTEQTQRKTSKATLSKSLSFDPSTAQASRSNNADSVARGDCNIISVGSMSSPSENNRGLDENSDVATQHLNDIKDRLVTNVQLYNILNDGALSPCICDPSYILLIDTRNKKDYDSNHILLARHFTAITAEAQNVHGFSTKLNVSEFTWVVLYGDGLSDDDSDDHNEIRVMKELEGCYDTETYILSSGFQSFEQLYPFLCSQHEKVDFKSIQVYPSIILDEQLYQGRGDQATNLKVVTDLQITHVINITTEHASAFPEKIQYLTLKLDDVSQTQLIKHFDKTTNFLKSAIYNGGRVLVHCNLGVSRSSTISIAYLIQEKKWTLQEAYEFLKDKRTCIRPNRGFLKQLAIWEEMKLGKKFTEPDDLWF